MARHRAVGVAVSWLRSPVRPRAALVSVLLRGPAVRATKQAIAEALRIDPAVSELVPAAQVFAVERATLPTLPSIELVGVSSERVDTGPLVKHELSVQCTVSHPTEDGADELLDSIVRVRTRPPPRRGAQHGPPDCPGDRRRLAGRGSRDTVVYLRGGQGERNTWGVGVAVRCGVGINRGPIRESNLRPLASTAEARSGRDARAYWCRNDAAPAVVCRCWP